MSDFNNVCVSITTLVSCFSMAVNGASYQRVSLLLKDKTKLLYFVFAGIFLSLEVSISTSVLNMLTKAGIPGFIISPVYMQLNVMRVILTLGSYHMRVCCFDGLRALRTSRCFHGRQTKHLAVQQYCTVITLTLDIPGPECYYQLYGDIVYCLFSAGQASLAVFANTVAADTVLTMFVGLFVGASINYTFRKMNFLDQARSELSTNYLICVALYSVFYGVTLAMLYTNFPTYIAGGFYRLGHCVNFFSIMLFLSDTTAAIKEKSTGLSTRPTAAGTSAAADLSLKGESSIVQ
jgi:hypothetical protein